MIALPVALSYQLSLRIELKSIYQLLAGRLCVVASPRLPRIFPMYSYLLYIRKRSFGGLYIAVF